MGKKKQTNKKSVSDVSTKRKIRHEIREILDKAKESADRAKEAAKRRKAKTFSMSQIMNFISDLKFKNEKEPEETTQQSSTLPQPQQVAPVNAVSYQQESYYARWYRLVTRK